jgi:hypothetical protein
MNSASVRKSEVIAFIATEMIIFIGYFNLFYVEVLLMNKLDLADGISNSFLIAFFGSIFFYAFYIASFIIVIFVVYCQARGLNKALENFDFESVEEFEVKKLLKRARKVHDTLLDVIEAISLNYAINTLSFLFVFFFFGLFSSYTVFIFFHETSIGVFYLLLSVMIWFVFYLPFFIYVGILSTHIETAMNRTVSILEGLAASKRCGVVRKNLSSLVLQSSHRRPVFSCGLLLVDHKSTFTILTGIFSFSIILIQFYDVK